MVRTLRLNSVPRAAASGPTWVVWPVLRLYSDTLLRSLPNTRSGSFGSGAAMPYSWMLTGCQSWKVMRPSIERLSTQAEPESCCAADAVRERVVGGDVVHRGSQLVVPVAPRRAAVAGDDRALVGDHEQDVGVVRVDPDVLVVVAARRAAYCAPGDAAVLGAPEHGRAAVDDVRVFRVNR